MTEEPRSSVVGYTANTPKLRNLAIWTTLFTLLTLGIYRFWARTRTRRYFWSAVNIEGHGFEYTGKGIEKFLGFLIAVAVLAIYLGVFQLLLSFAGMSFFNFGESDADQAQAILLAYASFIALAPLIFYAQYRARRYMLSRTKWKGIRFGAEPAAWGYCIRAIGHWALTLITLGILLPRQTFYLEKFKADRTWFGDMPFDQGGRWQDLYPAMKHMGIGVAITIIGAVLAGLFSESSVAGAFFGGVLLFVGPVWLYVGVLYYNLHSHRILTGNKTLGDGIRFTSEPRTGRVIGIYVLGSLIASFIAGVISGVLAGTVGFILHAIFGDGSIFGALDPETMSVGGIAGFVILYVSFLLVMGVCTLIFISQPMIQHYAEVTSIHNVDALSDANQREGDEMIEAEGFADALDVGAGF